MPPDDLPYAVGKFLRARIQSVGQLEILVLLSSTPGQTWTARAIEETLRNGNDFITRRLNEFVRLGLATRDDSPPEPTYRYQPSDLELGAAAAATVAVYRARPVYVIERIFNPEGSAAQSFADAFRIRPR